MNDQDTKHEKTSDDIDNDHGHVLIALGSHGRGDDSVGLYVAELLTSRLAHCRMVSGQDDCMAILNGWEGSRLAIVMDAAQSQSAPGTIHRVEPGAQPVPRELARCSSHGTGIAEAVELGRILNRLPGRLVIYAIEALSFSPGDEMSPVVRKAAHYVADRIVKELGVSSDTYLNNEIPKDTLEDSSHA